MSESELFSIQMSECFIQIGVQKIYNSNNDKHVHWNSKICHYFKWL